MNPNDAISKLMPIVTASYESEGLRKDTIISVSRHVQDAYSAGVFVDIQPILKDLIKVAQNVDNPPWVRQYALDFGIKDILNNASYVVYGLSHPDKAAKTGHRVIGAMNAFNQEGVYPLLIPALDEREILDGLLSIAENPFHEDDVRKDAITTYGQVTRALNGITGFEVPYDMNARMLEIQADPNNSEWVRKYAGDFGVKHSAYRA